MRIKPFYIWMEIHCRNCNEMLWGEHHTRIPPRMRMARELTIKGHLQVDKDWFCNLTCYELHRRLPNEL